VLLRDVNKRGNKRGMAMPRSIPFDSSLFLGSIVPPEKLYELRRLNAQKEVVTRSQIEFEAAVSAVRNLDNTLLEIEALDIEIGEIAKQVRLRATQRVKFAAAKLVEARLQHVNEIASISPRVHYAGSQNDSPVDFERTQIRYIPLESDSLRMNAQYFPCSLVNQTGVLSAYVSSTMSFLGAKRSADVAAAVGNQVSGKRSDHGTLIITATCTHRNVAVMSPLVLRAEAMTNAWNSLFPDKIIADAIDRGEGPQRPVNSEERATPPEVIICSGASYGSSFIGMVHMHGDPGTKEAKEPWHVAATDMLSVRRLMQSQSLSSNCSLVTVGVVPLNTESINGTNVRAILDAGSLIGTFNQYLQQVLQGAIGVPVKFTLTTYNRDQIANLQMNGKSIC
jgi:hypothetical protein